MEVKVGIQNTARELVVDTALTPQQVSDALVKAMKDGSVFSLEDQKGRRIVVPVATIAYVDIAHAEVRRVGFNAG